MNSTNGEGAVVSEVDVDLAGQHVRLLRAGAGRPILYLHGAGDMGAWLPALGDLAKDHLVLRPDHPGFNGSDDDPAVTSVRDVAKHYLRLMDALELDEVALVGSSLGGWIAAQVAALAPDRASALVLVNAAGVTTGAPVPNIFELPPVEVLELLAADDAALTSALEMARAVSADPALSARRARNAATARRLAADPYMHDPGLPAQLADFTGPALVLWGVADGLFDLAHAHRWLEVLPQASLVPIAGAGHVPPVDQPGRFSSLVREFLVSTRDAGRADVGPS